MCSQMVSRVMNIVGTRVPGSAQNGPGLVEIALKGKT